MNNTVASMVPSQHERQLHSRRVGRNTDDTVNLLHALQEEVREIAHACAELDDVARPIAISFLQYVDSARRSFVSYWIRWAHRFSEELDHQVHVTVGKVAVIGWPVWIGA